MARRSRREPLPLLFATLHVCKACGGTRFRKGKVRDQGDGSRSCYGQCKLCGASAKLVWEPSEL